MFLVGRDCPTWNGKAVSSSGEPPLPRVVRLRGSPLVRPVRSAPPTSLAPCGEGVHGDLARRAGVQAGVFAKQLSCGCVVDVGGHVFVVKGAQPILRALVADRGHPYPVALLPTDALVPRCAVAPSFVVSSGDLARCSLHQVA